jgi:hypothetical protein
MSEVPLPIEKFFSTQRRRERRDKRRENERLGGAGFSLPIRAKLGLFCLIVAASTLRSQSCLLCAYLCVLCVSALKNTPAPRGPR